jgi:hypothetical protein
MIAARAHSNDEHSDISGSLILLSTLATASMTLEDHCYSACDMRVGATDVHSSDGSYDIR